MAHLIKRETLPKVKVYDVSVQDTSCFFATSKESTGERMVLAHNCHRMSRDAQDVLLKPLEDKRLVGILCTTEPSKIRGTIRSRCEEYPIRKITREDILGRMRGVLEKENTGFEDDAVLTVIDHCGGHVRDVLNRLEMIAQLGNINLDVVREHLELGLVSTYYEVLLSLGEPAKALELVEGACDRVGVEDVSSGLAEAAMNSYRLAHDMFAEFTYVDRGLAEKVHSVYGDSVVQLAEYFLRRRTSKISLVCDIIRCAGGVPTTAPDAATAPPVKVHACEPQVALQAPSKQPAPSEPQVDPEPAQVSLGPVKEPVKEPVKAETKAKKDLREDGIGNMGGGDDKTKWPDPNAGSSVDVFAVPRKHPKRDQKERPTFKGGACGDAYLDEILTSEEWAREFRANWLSRGG